MRSCALFLVVSACAAPTGRLDIFITAEDTVTEGLDPGSDEENIQDGWTVRYTRFDVALGAFHATSSADASAFIDDPTIYTLDLLNAAASGQAIVSFPAATAVRYDKFSYELDGLNIAGTLAKDGTTKAFALSFDGDTRFGECGSEEGQTGFAVGAGTTTAIKPTIHGDHWFFTNNPHVSTPKRLASWLAASDGDGDGTITNDDLKAATQIGSLFPLSAGYNLTGLPGGSILSAYDFFAAQARTLGHFNGDGDCELIEVLAR